MALIKPYKGDFRLSQGFGGNPDYYKQFKVLNESGERVSMKGHNGIDYALPTGTEIVAPHNGVIKEINFDANGYGNYIRLENAEEGSVVAHLEKVDVTVGFQVKQGDRLGTSDNTGYSTGPHLHWGYYRIPRNRADGFGGYVDPTPYMQAEYIHGGWYDNPDNGNKNQRWWVNQDGHGEFLPVGVSEPVQPGDEPVTVVIETSTPDVSTGKLYTQEQYDAVMKDRDKFWKERDENIKLLTKKTEEATSLEAELSAFKATGFENSEQLLKAIETKDETINGLQVELRQALDRNKVIYEQLAQKDQEDSTAIELGINALRKAKELESALKQVHKVAGTDPGKSAISLFTLLQSIKSFKAEASKVAKQVQKEAKVSDEQIAKTAKKYNFEWLTKGLGLTAIALLSTAATTLVGISLII